MLPLSRYRALIVAYVWPQGTKVLLLALLLLSSVGLQLVNPQFLRLFIDAVEGKSPLSVLFTFALLYLGMAGAIYLLNIGQAYLSEDIGWSATNALRVDLALHLLRLDLSFHNARTPGELLERVDGDIRALFDVLSAQLLRVLSHILLLLGILGVVSLVDWRVGVGMTVYTVLAFLIFYHLRSFATPAFTTFHQAKAELAAFLEERLVGTEDIHSAGAGPYVMQGFYRVMHQVWRKQIAAALRGVTMQSIAILLFISGTTLFLALGAYLSIIGVISFGTIFLIYLYSQMLMQPLQGMIQELHGLQEANACLLRIAELLHTRPAIRDEGKQQLSPGPISVEFENVSFGYQEGRSILRDLSFCLQPGRTLGLLGRTGSGKTTIARLLFRLYEADSGIIRLNDTDVRAINLADIHKHVAYVTQDVQLFHASIRDNLTFFNPNSSDERIVQVLFEIGLEKWYMAQPLGLDSELTSGGKELSAGEAQLLALARAFLKDPDLVILDEASSHLDPATESLLEKALTRLLVGRTGIVIAHRLATLEHVDNILILEDGRVCEQGERAQLVSDPSSVFAGLLRAGLEEVLA